MKKILALLLLLPCLAFAQTSNYQINVIPAQNITTASVTSPTFTNSNCRGAHFIVSVNSYTSGSAVIHFQGGYYDVVNQTQNWYDLLVSQSIAATTGSPFLFKIYPGITILGNFSAADFLPAQWRVQIVGTTPNMNIGIVANCEL